MATIRVPSTGLLRSLRALTIDERLSSFRALSTSSGFNEQLQTELPQPVRPSFFKNPDPETVSIPRLERKLIRAGKFPVGSRRRRMAIATSQRIPFDELPYQCFQEARQILIADRAQKLKEIEVERSRISRLQQTDPATFAGGEVYKQKRIDSMLREVERLKILADINDPNVKRRFEDGNGDMKKPIYRYLAHRKWHEFRRRIQVQRLSQFMVYPDIVPHLDPSVDVTARFGKHNVQPGNFVESQVSEQPCQLTIQPFEKGMRMITVAVVDADVPNLEKDSFDTRCHFLASNIAITPSDTAVDLARLAADQVMLPWVPPTAQKGAPYHRICIIILEQKENIPVDLNVAMKKVQRAGFSMRSFMTKHMLHPVGGTLFRTRWDESMVGVMERAGIAGADIELKRTKIEPLPYKRRNPSTFR